MDWKTRAEAAEKTVAVLKEKVLALYGGTEKTIIQRQLEEVQRRGAIMQRRREVADIRSAELERHSAALETEVKNRTQDLRAILDNVTFGFLLVDRDLIVAPGYTASCHSLLGAREISGRSLADVLEIKDRRDRNAMILATDQFYEDLLPEEASAASFPARFERDGHVIRVEARATRRDDGAVANLLLSICDVTALEAAEARERHNAALVAILQHRASFRIVVDDLFMQLETAREAADDGDQMVVRRAIHTVKGNAASYGIDAVAALAHRTEGNEEIDKKSIEQIADELRAFLMENRAVLGPTVDAGQVFEISHARLDELRRIIDDYSAPRPLKRWAAEAQLKPFADIVGPLSPLVDRLSERLGKRVSLECNGMETLVDAVAMTPVVSAVPHLIRNAIDHAIEEDGERGEKPDRATLTIAVTAEDEEWVLRVRDDGRGIDADAVLERAIALGIVTRERGAALSMNEKIDLVFCDSLSTATEATEISGRGVGMGAVKAAVESSGGAISIRSQRGIGTEVIIRVAIPDVLSLAKAAE